MSMQDNVSQLPVPPPKKEKMRVVLKTGYWIDLDIPADFNMVAFVTSIKANGHIMNDKMFQPLDMVASIFLYEEQAPPQQLGHVLPFKGA